MSDSSISIVPNLSVYPEREIKAKAILEWLVSLDIVSPFLTDCVLSSSHGYAIAEGAKNISEEPELLPYSLMNNGLEIITERRIFHTGQNGIDSLVCPVCSQDISNKDWEFLSEWDDNRSNNLTCPLCNVPTEIHQFKFTPEWGFSDLGFAFWNWGSLKDSFIEDFRKILGCDISLVYTRI